MLKEIEFCQQLNYLWNAMYSEAYEDNQMKIGKLLTIIDGSIVDDKQNKAVKDLIKTVIWEDFERRTSRIADWMIWFNENVEIKDGESGSSAPYRYDGEDRNPALSNYLREK